MEGEFQWIFYSMLSGNIALTKLVRYCGFSCCELASTLDSSIKRMSENVKWNFKTMMLNRESDHNATTNC